MNGPSRLRSASRRSSLRGSDSGCSEFQRSTSSASRRSSLKLVTLQTSAGMPNFSCEHLGRREHFAQDRAGAEQLHAHLALAAACCSGYMPRRMPVGGASGSAGCSVVLVHHGDVVEDVFLLRVHAAHAVLDDDRELVRVAPDRRRGSSAPWSRRSWLWPSWCCRPSPASVVRPPCRRSGSRAQRLSPPAQMKSPTRWKPNIE